MPNQNECGCLVAIHAFSYNVVWIDSDPKLLKHVSRDTGYRVFNYCPNCGAKIDWDKIKEELDDK